MERFDRYLKALWEKNGLVGVLIVVAAAAGLIWLSGVDVAETVSALVNWNS
jgi:hypothetical protein